MSTVAPPSLMTVEELKTLPEPRGGYHELRHGELVFVTRPVMRHTRLQHQISRLLAAMLPDSEIDVDDIFSVIG